MDEWVRTPRRAAIETGTTSAVSVMADSQPAPRAFEDDEPTMSLGKAAEATVASMRTPAQTVIAEPLRQAPPRFARTNRPWWRSSTDRRGDGGSALKWTASGADQADFSVACGA